MSTTPKQHILSKQFIQRSLVVFKDLFILFDLQEFLSEMINLIITSNVIPLLRMTLVETINKNSIKASLRKNRYALKQIIFLSLMVLQLYF